MLLSTDLIQTTKLKCEKWMLLFEKWKFAHFDYVADDLLRENKWFIKNKLKQTSCF